MVCKKETKKTFPKDSRQVTQISPSYLPRHICCNKSGDASLKVTNGILLFLKALVFCIKLKHLQDNVMMIVIITHMLKILPDMLIEQLTKMLIEMLIRAR